MKKGKLSVSIGIQTSLIIIFLVAIQLIVIVNLTKKDLLEDAYSKYSELARSYSSEISSVLEKSKVGMDVYVNADVCKTENPAEIVSWLQAHAYLRRAWFDYVAFVDQDGNFESDIGTHTVVTDRDYFKAIMQNGADSFIDNPTPSKVSGKLVIHINRALKLDGKTIGFFSGVTTSERLSRFVENTEIGNAGVSALISENGIIIASSGDSKVVDKLFATEDAKKILSTSSVNGDGIINTANGKYYLFYSIVEGTDWRNCIVISEAEVLSIFRKIFSIIIISNFVIGIAVIFGVIVNLIRKTQPLIVLEQSINKIASGNADLTKRIELKRKKNDEVGSIIDSFNGFMEKLQSIIVVIKQLKDELLKVDSDLDAGTQDTATSISQIISNIKNVENGINSNSESVDQTTTVLDKISIGIDNLHNMIESQSACVTEASAAVEQMIGNINSVNSSIGKMAASFESLEQSSSEGVKKQDDVNSRILVIASESQSLQEANAVISSIAEQTNLLAMNAAIEAAHAGEAGKGFSVVADEIRKLSETSSEQSKTIGNQLQKITDGIEEIVSASKIASETFSAVSNEMVETNNLVSQIKNAMQEQGEGSRQISLALTQMNDSTVQVRESSKQMSEGGKEILNEIKTLQNSTLSMKQGMSEMSAGARKINETGNALSGISNLMAQSIKKLGNEVDLFKV